MFSNVRECSFECSGIFSNDGSGAVAVRLLHLACDRYGLARGLGGQHLAGRFASGGHLAGGSLLGAGHVDDENVEMEWCVW